MERRTLKIQYNPEFINLPFLLFFLIKSWVRQKWSQILEMIEEGYIEYGNIEKFCGLLNWKHNDGYIEFNFENGNIDSKTGS